MHGDQCNSVAPGGHETSEGDSGFRPIKRNLKILTGALSAVVQDERVSRRSW